MARIEFICNDEKIGVYEFLLNQKVSKRLIKQLKRTENGITKNGIHIRTIDTIIKGDIIAIFTKEESFLTPSNEIVAPVLFEDEDCIVFDKPPHMPVHPSLNHQGDTLGNCFSSYLKNITFRPVNRLDKDTSGCCLVAKNKYSASFLQQNLQKVYFAVVEGKLDNKGRIDLPISRKNGSIIERCISPDGQKAITNYEVLQENTDASFVEIHLETGRTHQIRVHFSHIGHPLLGDDLYGGKLDKINRQALHCGEISFTNRQNQLINVKSPLPADIKQLIF